MSKKKIAILALSVIADATFAFLCYAKGKQDGYSQAKEEYETISDCCGKDKCCDCTDKAVCDELEAEGEATEASRHYEDENNKDENID